MKYLITGGLGYLGSMISKKILNDSKHHVTVLDKGLNGVDHVSSLLNNKNFNVVIDDIRNIDTLKNHLKDIDIVIHLASLVGAPLVSRKPIEAYDVNITGTEILTKLISRNQKYLFASTGSTYGKVEGICTENSPISPLSPYGSHKQMGEEIVAEKNAISMRFATVYGLSYRTRNDLSINNMVNKALIDRSVVLYEGDAKRSFIHIEDVANAVKFLSTQEKFKEGPINIGDSKLGFSKKEICIKISDQLPFSIVENNFDKDADQRDYVVSYDLMKSLGFQCVEDIDFHISKLINYYNSKFALSYDNG